MNIRIMKKLKLPIQEGLDIKIRVENGFLVAEYSEEQKFKDGDFCLYDNGATSWMLIYKSLDPSNSFGLKSYASWQECNSRPIYDESYTLDGVLNILPDEDKHRMLNIMHKDGKDWDAVNRKVVDYVEPLKEGDLAILWNDDIASSCVKDIIRIIPRDDKSYLYGTEECAYENAIKCTSLEQYLELIK